ncbi:pyrroline-5-carboxylate reductase [Acetobacter thailandicus]|uniref:pyrroline-5-carboxylate reductase n=1 Tax=Acetobacter thailandicus TaxID=1502842 RepID=UPI001BA70A93|nr:pyrroline-5-carboxylate reductase [Acetobacter thailandicus]MBS0960645.1 pyrroline-5-carboxylate reductase [Acetobacter thailandicus]
MHDTRLLPSVLLAGCGKMGTAMLEGWLSQGLRPSVILDRHDQTLPHPHRHIRQTEELPADFIPDVIVMAVKPQTSDSLLHQLTRRFAGVPVLSLMAGRTLESLSQHSFAHTGHPPAIIRAMPNTPCALGVGMTGLYAGPHVTEQQKHDCEKLAGAVGKTIWVEQESQMDIVTAVSGSGPAYIFLLAELLEKAGTDQGLPPHTARELARQTIYGAGCLLSHSTLDAAELRTRVTSPGGTTAAALNVFMAPDAWPDTVTKAIQAAVSRSEELAS